jgi:hypothetical protein
MGRKSINRIGEIGYNSYGSKMEIIEYVNNRNIVVRFDNGYETKSRYDTFLKGEIKSPYCKTVYGVGYRGEGICKTIGDKYGRKIKPYQQWLDMLRRCYDVKLQIKFPTYKYCTVCDEWHNFQNYYKWYIENYYEIENERMEIDKDILVKGNKLYSPETCCIIPHKINTLFVKNDAKRGNLPIGVNYDKQYNKYESICNTENNNNGSFIYLGRYDSSDDAFYLGYKPFKEQYIKDIANQYKEKIPNKVYNAMINWKIEITD